MVRKLIPATLAAVMAATVSACAVGPDYHRPAVQSAPKFVAAEPAVYSADDSIGPFWGQFNDELLNGLVIEALAANHDLRIALAHLKQSRALLSQSRLDQLPTVTGAGGYNRQHYPAVESFGSGTALEERYYDAGFDATWELDLWGRVRREVEASRATVEGEEANLHDAQVSVTAEVARTYFQLRGQQTELAVLQRNAANQQETVDLTNSLLNAGRGTELDTSRAMAQLHSTLATLPPLRASIQTSIHRLSVLTGREPDALATVLEPQANLPELPRMAAVGDPAGLLRRRPDIRVAERRLAASTAQIGVAVGDLFPKVTFTGNFGYAAGSLGGLSSAGSKTFLIGPAISWPAFDLGRVRARINYARAGTEADLASYEQTVLRALEETENALVAHARARDRLVQLTAAAQESDTAFGIARARYEGGLVGFLDVLDAERTQLEAQDQLAQGRTDAATSLIAVYKALGGGWEGAPLPVARVTTAGAP